jgi:CopG family nickel-responsive transcriptional regulator
MQRVTITVDEGLMADIDRLIAARGYQNRSEAIRDLARAGLQQASAEIEPQQPCVAALVYTYDHTRRELSKRLTDSFHHHHDLSIATLHVHLDEARCLEVNVLKGLSDQVRHFADHVIAERGLQHGQLIVLPAETTYQSHHHQETASDAA